MTATPTVRAGATMETWCEPAPLPRATARLLLLTAGLLPLKLGSGGPLTLADIGIVLVYASLLPKVPRLPRAAKFPGIVLLLALTGSAFVSFFGDDDYAMRWGVVRLVGYVLLLAYLAAFHHGFRRQPRLVMPAVRAFVASTAIVNALLLPRMPTRPILELAFHQKWDSRLSGALYDPNANGAVLALCLILVVFGPAELVLRRWLRVGMAILLVVCLAWTFSRGAAAGAALGFLYCGSTLLKRKPRLLLGVVLGGLLAIGLIVASGIPEMIAKRYEDRPASSVSNRVGYVEMSIGAFQDDPLLGAGLGHGSSTAGAVTHATFFWLLGDAGIFAAVGYALLMWAGVRAAHRSRFASLRSSLLGCLLALGLMSFSFEALYQRPLWFLLAIAFATTPLRRTGHGTARAATRSAVR